MFDVVETIVLLKFADPVSDSYTFAIDEASNRWPIMVFLVPWRIK
jgi:hypothetical protein